MMLLLGVDPSSTRTGYALMTAADYVDEAGYLRPVPATAPAIDRILQLADDLDSLIADRKPTALIIEITSGKPGTGLARGANARLAVYGMAVGALWMAAVQALGRQAVTTVDERTWTRGVPKVFRQQRLAAEFQVYRDKFRSGFDSGADVSDAIGLCQWWFNGGGVQERASG